VKRDVPAKRRAERVGPSHYVLSDGVPVPVHVFLSDELYRASDDNAWEQMVTAASFPGVRRVAVTPDTHVGYGVPIGIVIETEDTLIPTAAGYDIGCGMVQLRSTLTREDVGDPKTRTAWIRAVEERIAVGVGAKRSKRQRVVGEDLFQDILRSGARALGRDSNVTERDFIPVEEESTPIPETSLKKIDQLGSLGGGNHFCEMQIEEGTERVWVMIHTGSRGFGWNIANHFFNEGADLLRLPRGKRDYVHFRYDSDIGRRYWSLHNMAANFAIANRLLIGEAVCSALEDVFGGEADIFYEISHNLIQREDGAFVHRKGATRAFPRGHHALHGTAWEETGHPILIPGSMATGSAILFAEEGAKVACYSVNHGSGRLLSRAAAKKQLQQSAIDRQMKSLGIVLNMRSTPIDEAGPCYKDLRQVLASVEEARLATVAHRLRPVACIKGND
jgi:tRNA-splicing ligase RtcB (3'-phosphate/5'-hydroxy nucleic acid ligase)